MMLLVELATNFEHDSKMFSQSLAWLQALLVFAGHTILNVLNIGWELQD